MSHVLVPSHPGKTSLVRTPRAEPLPPAGTVTPDRLAVFERLEGHGIHCLSGHLWVTFENDPMDRVLKPGQRLVISRGGKVVVGGRGRYQVRRELP